MNLRAEIVKGREAAVRKFVFAWSMAPWHYLFKSPKQMGEFLMALLGTMIVLYLLWVTTGILL